MDSVNKPLVEITDMFHKRMAAFEEELKKASSTSATSLSDNLATDFAAFKAFMIQSLHSLQQQIELISRSQDQLEMRSRRKMLLLHGVQEEKNEDPIKIIVDVVNKHLKLADFSAGSIRRCQRLGRKADTNKCRPLLVKLNDVRVRDEMWFNKTKLKGSEITISEFLTKTRHDIFMMARKTFGVSRCWTREGQIFVLGPDEERRRICSLADINKIPHTEAVPKPTAATKGTTNIANIKTRRAAATKK